MVRIFSVFILLILSFPSFAQVKNGVERPSKTLWQNNGISINDSQGRSVRQNGRIAATDDGNSVVVWEDSRNGFTDIYAQRMNSKGTRLWGREGIAVIKGEKNQTFPQVINAGKNNVIIAWQDYRGGYSDIYAQKLDAKGNPLWKKEGVVVCRASANQLAPQLASDGNGGAIITWYDYRSGKGEDLYAQRLNSEGSNEWQADGMPICLEPATQWYPQIISDGLGGAIICWDDKRSGYYDIFAQRIDASGNPIWAVNGLSVCSAPENQEYSQLASAEGGNIVITWQDYRNGNADIYAQKLDLNGRVVWKTNGEAVCMVSGNQEKPQIIGGERPVIAWTDFRNGSGNSDIFCQKLASNGTPAWNMYGVGVCEAPGNQGNPKMVPDGTGGAAFIWQDERGGSPAVYARRVNGEGKALWAPDGKTICNSTSQSEFPSITRSINGDYFVVWQDKKYGGLDIFVQNLDEFGQITWAACGIEAVFGFGSVTQQKPRIIKCSDGNYLIVFEDYRNGYSNIYAQKIDNAGKYLWARDGLRVCEAVSNQFNPDIVNDNDGGAIFTWEDSRSGKMNIFAQKIDPFGNKIWDENGIMLCQADGERFRPRMASDLKGGAFVAWEDNRKKGDIFNIFVQRINNNGSLLFKPEGLQISGSDGGQSSCRISADGEGGAVLSWVEFKYRGNVNTPDVYAQRIDSKGKSLWGPLGVAVCKAPEAQRNPELSVSTEVIIVWEDSGGGNYDIYAQKIDKAGTVIWECDGIPVCTAPYTQHEPKFIQNSDGGATIIWEDYRKAEWDIFAQRIDNGGQLAWGKEGVAICTSSGTQYAPQIVRGSNLSSIVVWEDYRNNKSYNIYSQKISKEGGILWSPDGEPVCLTEGGARNPQIVDDGAGGAIVVWTDYRYGNYDIYAQRINEDKVK